MVVKGDKRYPTTKATATQKIQPYEYKIHNSIQLRSSARSITSFTKHNNINGKQVLDSRNLLLLFFWDWIFYLWTLLRTSLNTSETVWWVSIRFHDVSCISKQTNQTFHAFKTQLLGPTCHLRHPKPAKQSAANTLHCTIAPWIPTSSLKQLKLTTVKPGF